MPNIDLICELEPSPKIRLFIEHMATLGIEFTLHDDVPNKPSSPFVLAPRPNNSKWRFSVADTPTLSNHQDAVAVYFDKNPQQIATQHHCGLEKWPARSTDRLLHTLAARLKRLSLAQPQVDENAPNNSSSDQTTNHSRAHQPTEKTGGWVMGALISALVVMFVFADLSNKSSIDEPGSDANVEPPALVVAEELRDLGDLGDLRETRITRDTNDLTHNLNPSAPQPADHFSASAEVVRSSTHTRVHKPRQAIPTQTERPTEKQSLCSSDQQVFQATLTWQQDTSFTCSLSSAHSSPLWVTSSNTKATIQKHTE